MHGPWNPDTAASGQTVLLSRSKRLVIIGNFAPSVAGSEIVGAVVALLSATQKSPVCVTLPTVLSEYSLVAMYVGATLSTLSCPGSENGVITVTRSAVWAATAPTIPPPKVTAGLLENLSRDVDEMVILEPPAGERFEIAPSNTIGATLAVSVTDRLPPEAWAT